MLDVIHSPSSTEELSHFPNAILKRLNVSPISTLNLIQSTIQANTGHIVFNAIQPFIKLWQTFNFNHEDSLFSHHIVFDRIQYASNLYGHPLISYNRHYVKWVIFLQLACRPSLSQDKGIPLTLEQL